VVKSKYTIIVDTREQLALFKTNIIRKKVDTGDYSIIYKDVDYSNKIAIERKSMGDLFFTLSAGHKRFKNELHRALDLEYFAIVIDGSYSDCIYKQFPGANMTRMRGNVISSILFTIHMKYGINFFFSNNRTQSKAIIRELFSTYCKIQDKKDK